MFCWGGLSKDTRAARESPGGGRFGNGNRDGAAATARDRSSQSYHREGKARCGSSQEKGEGVRKKVNYIHNFIFYFNTKYSNVFLKTNPTSHERQLLGGIFLFFGKKTEVVKNIKLF